MSRLKRFTHSLFSGYVLLAANMLYTFGSLRLVQHYVPNLAEFELWALTTAWVGYIALVDLGLSGAMSRILIDYKDEEKGSNYGSVVQTACLVGLVQGAIILVASLALFFAAGHLAKVNAELVGDFRWLVAGQAALMAANFMTRIFNNLLWAHQRMDITNYTQSVLFPVSFAVLWLSLRAGCGLFSMIWAQLAAWAIGAIVQVICCARLNLFPKTGRWGHPTWTRFHEVFAFGKDLFLFALGSQMINASQPILVNRCLDVVGAAAVWMVCTRAYFVVCQLVWKFFEAACTPLSEMLVREETELCIQRFRGVTILTASSAVLTSILFVACNQTFVQLWMGEKYCWSAWNDLLLGIWAVVMAIQRCHVGLLGAKKQLQVVKYIYFLEGTLFICLALLFTRQGGFPALIGSSILSTLTCSFFYGSYTTMKDFRVSLRELVCDWMGPARRLAAFMVPLAWIVWMAASRLPPIAALAVMAVVIGGVGTVLFFRIGLDLSLQKEFARKMPRKIAEILGLAQNDARANGK